MQNNEIETTDDGWGDDLNYEHLPGATFKRPEAPVLTPEAELAKVKAELETVRFDLRVHRAVEGVRDLTAHTLHTFGRERAAEIVEVLETLAMRIAGIEHDWTETVATIAIERNDLY